MKDIELGLKYKQVLDALFSEAMYVREVARKLGINKEVASGILRGYYKSDKVEMIEYGRTHKPKTPIDDTDEINPYNIYYRVGKEKLANEKKEIVKFVDKANKEIARKAERLLVDACYQLADDLGISRKEIYVSPYTSPKIDVYIRPKLVAVDISIRYENPVGVSYIDSKHRRRVRNKEYYDLIIIAPAFTRSAYRRAKRLDVTLIKFPKSFPVLPVMGYSPYEIAFKFKKVGRIGVPFEEDEFVRHLYNILYPYLV
ncbi:MAG: hypothetical protein DRO14_00425 [Thermoprotei archaeon]|nr:MAG: hypothetical protein DRO14_00010 [Thermoprotei archaeon]RLG78614.1 MAG: hypothetical protein DRO14_00425 [Thermoprotei archaeon]